MQIDITRTGAKVTVTPMGRLDSNTAGEFDTAMTEAIAVGPENVTVDAAGVDFISSKGLRILIKASRTGTPVTVINANGAVREVIRLSGLTKLFGLE